MGKQAGRETMEACAAQSHLTAKAVLLPVHVPYMCPLLDTFICLGYGWWVILSFFLFSKS